ncbi:YcjF family protein [Halovulum sp. GXIMD14794]
MSGKDQKPRGPILFEGDALEPGAPSVAEAPPVPEPDAPPPQGAAMKRATGLAARRAGFGTLVLGALGALVSLALGVAAWDFVMNLLSRNAVLGNVALALVLIVLVGLLAICLRELAAILRLSRLGKVQARAADPLARSDRTKAAQVCDDMLNLYAGRDQLRLPAEQLAARQSEILDADALMDATETALMTPLDAAARAEVESAARQVAAATAMVPLALADVIVALTANLRMIRRISQVYGGRGGTLGSFRLLRTVAQHLIATGAVAVGDDMLGSIAGGGVMSKLSRRFGEGIINGTLTARVGIAAIEVCRPMPFATLPRPRTTRLVQRALSGLFGG